MVLCIGFGFSHMNATMEFCSTNQLIITQLKYKSCEVLCKTIRHMLFNPPMSFLMSLQQKVTGSLLLMVQDQSSSLQLPSRNVFSDDKATVDCYLAQWSSSLEDIQVNCVYCKYNYVLFNQIKIVSSTKILLWWYISTPILLHKCFQGNLLFQVIHRFELAKLITSLMCRICVMMRSIPTVQLMCLGVSCIHLFICWASQYRSGITIYSKNTRSFLYTIITFINVHIHHSL